MSEVLIDHGIGETRAVVVEGDAIAEAHVEREDGALRFGDSWAARLVEILVPGRRGVVDCGGTQALLEPLPAGLAEGGLVRVEVVREALPEAGRPRLAKVRATDGPVRGPGRIGHGPTLSERLAAAGHKVRDVTLDPRDRLEQLGWSELAESATTGHVAFPGGMLTISPTPAMTVIDIDGPGELAALAEAAADAAAAAIRRLGITGSIGIDFPSLGDKGARTRLGERLDGALPPPFERTGINGFGFVQIVRPRHRASLVELLRLTPVPSAGLALLRAGLRAQGAGARELVAAPPVIDWLMARPELTAELERRTGSPVRLRPDATLGIAAGHAAVIALR